MHARVDSRIGAGRAVSKGLALIMVLWITAVLSILVASISYAVRGELRQVAALRASAVEKAAGRSAMILALQELDASSRRRLDRPERATYTINGTEVEVLALPLNGLVDINRAPVPLLVALLQYAGGMAPDAAQNLAATIAERRSTRTSQGASGQFDAVEELAEIPGVDYELYARLAPLVTVNAGGGAQVNPYAAPAALLAVLASGNHAAVSAFVAGRDSGMADLSGFNSAFLSSSGSSRLRLYARSVNGSQNRVPEVCDVNFMISRGSGGLPWEISQCDAQTTPMW